MLHEDEEIEDGFIQHSNKKSIRVSWIGDDPESGIATYLVGIGTSEGDVSLTNGYIKMGTDITAEIEAQFLTFSESHNIYYVAVKAENAAGILSNPIFSTPIKVLNENIPGIIYDGREPYADERTTNDRFSIAMHFQGFQSEACNIVKYEWAIGSQPYFSDINDFTEYGLDHNETHGKAQIYVQMEENKTYHVTVRAKTGHNCHEEYIVSTSDGITSDFSPPEISSILPHLNEGQYFDSKAIYQSFIDSFEYKWNVSDQSPLKYVKFSVGSYPQANDIIPLSIPIDSQIPSGLFSPNPGIPYFVNVFAMDDVGFVSSQTSSPIVADISPPAIKNFECTKTISTKQSAVTCSWRITETESKLAKLGIHVGSKELMDDIVHKTTLASYQSTWTTDVKKYQKLNSISNVYVTLIAANILDQFATTTFKIDIDATLPVIENITLVTWTNPGKERGKQLCQIPWTYVDLNVSVLKDEESGIER